MRRTKSLDTGLYRHEDGFELAPSELNRGARINDCRDAMIMPVVVIARKMSGDVAIRPFGKRRSVPVSESHLPI
jgi:hypothetical protein